MPALTSAPAKLLLFGDHAAVYGYPALGIPLPWKLTVNLTSSPEMEWDLPQKYLVQLNPILPKIKDIFPEANGNYRIQIVSEAPIGMGFGSSGALCVALSKALFAEMGKVPSTEEIWRRAHLLETYFHSSPSGVDTGISAFEKGGFFIKNGSDLPTYHTLPPFQTPLVIGAIPRIGSTGSLVSGLRERLSISATLMGHIEHLGKIAEIAPNALNSPEQFGKLANQAHSHLAALGLSNPQLDDILQEGISQGALGGKLSGAGGGGAFYFVCPTLEVARKLVKNGRSGEIERIIYP